MGILLKVFADRAEVVLTIVCSLYRLLQYISCYLAQGEAQRKEWTKYVRETVKNGAPKAISNSYKKRSGTCIKFWRMVAGAYGPGLVRGESAYVLDPIHRLLGYPTTNKGQMAPV